jgi:hypothetical protein
MNFEKALLQNSVDVLMEKAEDSFDLAKTQHELADQQHASADKLHARAHAQHEMADKQHEHAHKQHENADKQHESADKLDTLGRELQAGAVELKGEMEIDAVRTSPRPVMLPDTADPLPAGTGPAAVAS